MASNTVHLTPKVRFAHMANVGGTPGSVNIHTQGHIARFEHCIAENEEENPWEPLHVERGYAPNVSTVTLVPACPAAMIDDNGGSQTPKDILVTFAHSIAYVGNRNTNGEGEPVLIIGPQHGGGEPARLPAQTPPIHVELLQPNENYRSGEL